MNEPPVRWGILGAADILRRFLPGALQAGNATMLAIASRDGERATRVAEANGIPRVHDSYDALLADPDVEAVYIPLPNSLHHRWTLAALAAGKHVLCEKPYSRHPGAVEEAFDAAERAGLLLMEAFMWRHNPQTARMVELLPEIGDLQTIRATFSFRLDARGDIRLRTDLEGGSLMDVGCYCVSGARLLARSDPVSVHAEQVLGPSGVDVRFTGLLRFPNDVIAEFTSGFTTEHTGIEAIGSEGTIHVADPWLTTAGRIVVNGREILTEPDNAYRREVENFSGAIRGQVPPLLGRADALGQATTIQALYASAATGQATSPTM